MKTIILGGPRTGKTTRAQQSRRPVRSLDALKDLPWSAQSAEGMRWISQGPDCVIEGTAGERVLRKWLDQHPGQPLRDVEIVRLTRPVAPQTPGQQAMQKGQDTIWAGIKDELVRRGARLRDG